MLTVKKNPVLLRANEAKKIINTIKKSDDQIQASLKQLFSKKIKIIDEMIEKFEDNLEGLDSLQLNQIHTSLLSEWQKIRNKYINIQSNMRIEYLNQFENVLTCIDLLSRELPRSNIGKKKPPEPKEKRTKLKVTNDQLENDYRRLMAAIFSEEDSQLKDYIANHTKEELKQFCKINHITVNFAKNKNEIKDNIRSEMIKNKVW